MIRVNSILLAYIELLPVSEKAFFIEETVDVKTKIIEQDRRYSWVYIIKEGLAKCYLTDENGKDFIQEFLSNGMQFGELEVFTGKPSYCCIECLTPTTTYKISYSNFNKLLSENKKFNRLVMEAMAAKITYKAPRHSFQQGYPIEDNILRLKEEFPKLMEAISKQDIANYLGVTLRSLNRALKQLKTNDM